MKTKSDEIIDYIEKTYLLPEKIGEMIEPELQIAKKFNCSRQTVRISMNKLSAQGYIERKRGKGTIVASIKHNDNTKQLQVLSSYSEDMSNMGIEYNTRLLKYELISEPTDWMKKEMKLGKDDMLHHMKRVRSANGKPISMDVTYLSTDVVSTLDISVAEKSLYKYLEGTLKLVILSSEQLVEAVLADEEIATALQIKIGEPVLKITGHTKTLNNKIFELTSVYYRNDSYKLQFSAIRKNESL